MTTVFAANVLCESVCQRAHQIQLSACIRVARGIHIYLILSQSLLQNGGFVENVVCLIHRCCVPPLQVKHFGTRHLLIKGECKIFYLAGFIQFL